LHQNHYRFMTTSQFARKQSQLRAALEAAAARLAPHFPNHAARASAAAYLQSLLSQVERKNSWQLAEAAGLANPYGASSTSSGARSGMPTPCAMSTAKRSWPV
jgi:hypothetical protein